MLLCHSLTLQAKSLSTAFQARARLTPINTIIVLAIHQWTDEEGRTGEVPARSQAPGGSSFVTPKIELCFCGEGNRASGIVFAGIFTFTFPDPF